MFSRFIASDLPLFWVRVAIVTFFSIGFVQVLQRIWILTFEKTTESRAKYWYYRLSLTLLTVGLGLFIHYDAMLFIHNSSAILYHNWALFILGLPLFFGGFSKLETLVQVAALLLVWRMHHDTPTFEPQNLVAFIAFVGVAILIKVNREFILRYWPVGILGAFTLAGLFWFTVPEVSMGMAVPRDLALEATLLYTIMTTLVLGYWMRQYREDMRKRQLERLADYEKGASTNSYTNHQKELAELFATTQEQQAELSFATLDLDHFHQINDRYGYLAGNAVLIGVTETIRQILAKSGVDAKLFLTTGEEFNIAFPNQATEAVLPVIEACWQGIRKRDFTYEDRSIDVTMSVGITELRPSDHSVNDVYKRADDALSKAKRGGRDAVVLDDKLVSGAEQAERRLEDYQFFAQGIHATNSETKPLASQELLLRAFAPLEQRWQLPDSFEIPVWMQVTLIRNFMSNATNHHFNLNLTAEQFQDIEVAKALTQFVESPEGPDSLTVEIMNLTDSQTTRRISALYRASGMAIMIDDVGSDNSFELVRDSLPYINGIKFAMQNLRKTTSDEALQQRIRFWLDIAKEYQLKFVLEGVETEADVQLAKAMGVDYLQGYYFGKPYQAGPVN